ncbi:MAG TPA: hypothetical protein VKZ53_13190 [Candidatus Angelobacter sp.]|nr:hypothetical protein [Candidatus Angelobacter sp.]
MKWVPDRTGRFVKRPHYFPEELDAECEQIILSFLKKKYGKAEFPIKTDDLTILIEQNATLDSCADLSHEEGDVEGVTEFVRGKRPLIKISNSLSSGPHSENRLRTTLTHEYGHVHFHQRMFEVEAMAPSLFSSGGETHSNKCKRDKILNAVETDWMEWQAGYVCGAFLMPIGALLETVQTFRINNNLPFANLALGSKVGQRLIAAVATTFQTSEDAARVRLLKKRILKEEAATRELF